jgi:hypothetical protein
MLNKSIMLMLVYIVLVLSFGLWQSTQAQDGNEAENFRLLLEEIQLTAQNEPSIIIFFTFYEPLGGNINENTLAIPTENTTENVTINISRIGNDYICFYDRGGSAVFETCTPFSNIVSIGYLTN